MKARNKDLLEDNVQTIEKFKKGIFANNQDLLKIIYENMDNITFEIRERRMGVNEESILMKMTIKKV